ncbi:MAG: C69 family dipeptidase [Candidatus Jordarchaeum sp.]|uniref:C69 family dipeptidase n=1 Tax=Candidatus Jordarchaeum sp. TaxID=2823881 RepID=UPI00404A5C9B
MCDTLVALGNSTEDGSVIFGKNSDRPPNEAQVIRHFPRMEHPEGSKVKCTYIEIPQVPETLEVILSCPFWIWGAEMGVNEYGVAIGNEAVWSKEPYAETGLLGMDLLRLGLERGETARRALEIIVELLEQYGQGGNCFFDQSLMYHNSFLIADTSEAWVLETADKYWVAEYVKDVRSISNGYTIGKEWDLASPDLVEHAIEKGWCKSKNDFNFALCYGEPGMREIVHCVQRFERSSKLLQEKRGKIKVKDMMNYLRDHGGMSFKEWNPDKQITTVCMHSGPMEVSQSTGSYVGHLTEELPTHWLTGGSNPCISVFIPFYISAEIPETFTKGNEKYSEASFWWNHEKLARKIQEDYPQRASLIVPEIETLQSKFLEEASNIRKKALDLTLGEAIEILENFTNKCVETVVKKSKEWLKTVEKTKQVTPTKSEYLDFLKSVNESAGLKT